MSRIRELRGATHLNNYTEEEKESLGNMEHIKYKDMRRENKEPHIYKDIYRIWKFCKFINIEKKINKRIHWEKEERSQKAAIQYCKKKATGRSGLQKPRAGRSDLKDAYNIIRTQTTKKGIRKRT